jgi:hypothetical protein
MGASKAGMTLRGAQIASEEEGRFANREEAPYSSLYYLLYPCLEGQHPIYLRRMPLLSTHPTGHGLRTQHCWACKGTDRPGGW